MQSQTSSEIINRFVRNIKLIWQIVFLISVVLYGLSFLHHLYSQTVPRPLAALQLINWVSFILAVVLAVSIFYYKRKYFSLRSFRKYLESLHKKEPSLDAGRLLKRFTREMGGKMKNVWYMGGGLILLGVVYYWITYDSWNMHVYFIVGLYSLVMNYPRKDLFIDVPYLIHETIGTEENQETGAEE